MGKTNENRKRRRKVTTHKNVQTVRVCREQKICRIIENKCEKKIGKSKIPDQGSSNGSNGSSTTTAAVCIFELKLLELERL